MTYEREVWVCPVCRAYKDIDQYSVECPYCGATFKDVKKRSQDYGRVLEEHIENQALTTFDIMRKGDAKAVELFHELDDDRIKIGPYSTVMLMIATIISFLIIMTPVYIESVFPRADNFELNAYMMFLVMGMIASSGMMVYIKVKERIRPEPIEWEVKMEVV